MTPSRIQRHMRTNIYQRSFYLHPMPDEDHCVQVKTRMLYTHKQTDGRQKQTVTVRGFKKTTHFIDISNNQNQNKHIHNNP